jgi:hypothetical protein
MVQGGGEAAAVAIAHKDVFEEADDPLRLPVSSGSAKTRQEFA